MLIEQEELKATMLKAAQDQHIEAQRKIREEMVRERNKEIEAIIEKLGDETHMTQQQVVAEYERKYKALQHQQQDALQE